MQAAMQTFVEKIVSMMKSEGLFEWQGGPIILAQVISQKRRTVQSLIFVPAQWPWVIDRRWSPELLDLRKWEMIGPRIDR